MKRTYTQGPWKVGKERNPMGEVRIVPANNENFTIALTREDYIGSEMRDANARLIAAAPDLLEALHHAINMLGNQYSGEGREKGWKSIEAAISKAEGRE